MNGDHDHEARSALRRARIKQLSDRVENAVAALREHLARNGTHITPGLGQPDLERLAARTVLTGAEQVELATLQNVELRYQLSRWNAAGCRALNRKQRRAAKARGKRGR